MSPRARRQQATIALVVESLHETAGGAERVLVDTANSLVGEGFDVVVVTNRDGDAPSFYRLHPSVRRLNADTRKSPRPRPQRIGGVATGNEASYQSTRTLKNAMIWLRRYVPRIMRLRRVIRVSGADVVVAFMPSMFPYTTIAALGLKPSVIAAIHNVPMRELGGDRLRWDQNPIDIRIRKWSLRQAAAITVLLPSFVSQLQPKVQAKTVVVPNMIHPGQGSHANVGDAEMNTVLAVGRLVPAKDHATLVNAWARLENEFSSWQLRIIGEGPLHNELARQVVRLGLQRVTLDEPTSDIDAAYGSAKLLAMSSLYEGFGLVTAEALVRGLPVVGFADCPGTNELVVDGVGGVLVDPHPDRVTAFARALADLMSDEQKRVNLGKGAPATVAHLSPERIIEKWVRLLRDVQNQGSSFRSHTGAA